jgi:HPt (histidine-containing phosphotransfer) domain-containing protein
MKLDPAVLDPHAIAQLRELGDGDDSVLLEILEAFLVDAGAQVAAMEAAREAGDAGALERVAHTLKSTAATVGATLLASLCRELEELARTRCLERAPERVARVHAELRSVEASLRS